MNAILTCKKHGSSYVAGNGCYECLLEKHAKRDIVDVLLNEPETTPEDCARAAAVIKKLRNQVKSMLEQKG